MAEMKMPVGVALSEVPVNVAPLIDDTDFKTIEDAVVYNAGGMALRWHFVTPAGAYTVTSVTPTTAGDYDWTDQGDAGIYTIEIPASGGASINNDTIGYGWFTGKATGVLPWRGPIIEFGVDIAAVTTITGLSSQTVWNLTAGSANDNAYNGYMAFVRDAAGTAQVALGIVQSYTGSTKTVTLEADPAVFTMVNGDYVVLVPAPDGLTAAQAADVNTEADTALTDMFGAQTTGDLAALITTADAAIDVAVADLANATDGLGAIKADTAAILVNTAEIGVAGAGLTAINLPDQTMDITGNLSGSVGSVTGAVGSVTGAVGSVTGAVASVTGAVGSVAGNVDGNVTGTVAGVTPAAAGAQMDLVAAPNATAVTAIQSGLATSASITALNDLSAAAVNAEVDTAIADYFGSQISDSVNDGAATASSFTVTTSQGAKILTGVLRFTSGAISGEARLVHWTGTTVACADLDSIPAGLEEVGPFSAGPANAVTFVFNPLS